MNEKRQELSQLFEVNSPKHDDIVDALKYSALAGMPAGSKVVTKVAALGDSGFVITSNSYDTGIELYQLGKQGSTHIPHSALKALRDELLRIVPLTLEEVNDLKVAAVQEKVTR